MAKHPSSGIKNGVGWESGEEVNGESTSVRVAVHTPDFPAEVDERLGLFEQGEITPSRYEERLRDSIDMIGQVWDFCFEDGRGKFMAIDTPQKLQFVLRRFVVLSMMFRADRLSKHTLRSLCKLLPRNVESSFESICRVPLSKIGLEAAARFSFKSSVQKPVGAIAKAREAAKRGHATRKERIKKDKEKARRVAAKLRRQELQSIKKHAKPVQKKLNQPKKRKNSRH